MRVTNATKYGEFVPLEKYLSEHGKKQLMQAAEKEFGGMYDLSFSTFYACANGDYSEVLGNVKEPTVLAVYWVKRFTEFVEELANTLKNLTLPQTVEEMQASQGLLKMDWGESMLVFLQDYFRLPSFKEAEKITIGELLIAKRATYNREKFRKALNDIQIKKIRKK